MAVWDQRTAYNGLPGETDLQNCAGMSRQTSVLLEYIKLYSDPQAKDQLVQFLQYHASELKDAAFYDAAIVYAAADRDLALEIKHKLSSLSLENQDHPQICLYDEQELMSPGVKLPNVLIDRCALILLLLTENFESDEQVQFVNQQVIENTRFCQDVPHWQFYCVRPLHSQPVGQRTYRVPAGMENIRSYQVHDLDNVQETEKLESLFNCYSWFRRNHEKRCCVNSKELSETQPKSNIEVSLPVHNGSTKPGDQLMRGDMWCVNGQESLDSVSDIETCSDSASYEFVEGEVHSNLVNGHWTHVNGVSSSTNGREADSELIKGRTHRQGRSTTHSDTRDDLTHNEQLTKQINDSKENLLPCAEATRPESMESLSHVPFDESGYNNDQFYDAALVYAVADRDLALETRSKLSSLTMENNQRPKICLYDEGEFTKPRVNLPGALIDRCALILLILTENFEDDERVKFVIAPSVDSTRFRGVNHWQFYCVRPLHMEPERDRSYSVPHILSSVRSYDVYNLDTPDQKETMTRVFNCYSWFRGNSGGNRSLDDDRNTLDSGYGLLTETITPPTETSTEDKEMADLEALNLENINPESIELQSCPETKYIQDVPYRYSTQPRNITFYDAVIVYAAADRDLAVDIKNKMSGLNLRNNKQPRICMYDEEEFYRSVEPLPNVLVERCALILLVLTENFEDDDNIQFVNVSNVPNTRFEEVQKWQFYCVRPLHTQPKPLRFYSIPALVTDNRSYDVFDMEAPKQREALEGMFNCYTWFRENQERKLVQDFMLEITESPGEATEQITEQEIVLLEYLHLCNDPNSAHKLKDFVFENLSQLKHTKFYDAVIVYATEDTDLAIEIRRKLSCLKQGNNQHPQICLYDQLDFVSHQNLPQVLVNRCALILILLTERSSQDEKLNFLNQKIVKDTRFGKEFEDWQFYCVRPLHTQPEGARSYNIPDEFSSLRSYSVYDIEAQEERETLEDLFNLYSWFRRSHESRCVLGESSAEDHQTSDHQTFEVTSPAVREQSVDHPEMPDAILDSAESVENTKDKQWLTEEQLSEEKLLSEYMQLCYDPAAGSQLTEFLQTVAYKLPKDAFYDAAIVYSTEDRNLALEMKSNLSNLILQNNERPRICLYDEFETGRMMKLPETLINRCALIFLLLTPNFEYDDEVQFLRSPVANSPRFTLSVQPWQFYCVRPLHTQPESNRCYEVPEGLESVRSYSVYNLDSQWREEFVRVLSSYQWFRKGHEKRCYGGDVVHEQQVIDSENEKEKDKEITTNHTELISEAKDTLQLKNDVQVQSTIPLEGQFFDAAIVYAAVDRNLALEIRNKLSRLNLENKDHPRICLYDEEELTNQEMKFPDVLIDQCALILLLMTENFDDERVQFIDSQALERTRFAGVNNWQFYCVRPLHTQPPSERCYKVPAHLEPIRSYQVYDLESEPTQETFQDLFNCYSWFRRNRENRISNAVEDTRVAADLLQEMNMAEEISDISDMSNDAVDQKLDKTLADNTITAELPGTKEIQQSRASVQSNAAVEGLTPVESGSTEDLDTEAPCGGVDDVKEIDVDKTDVVDVLEDDVSRQTAVKPQTTPELLTSLEGLDSSSQASTKQTLLSEYIKLCSDPSATKQQLNDFLQTNGTQLSGSSFYDAAIVYAAADRNLALEMRDTLCSLILENKEHPRICLYDDEELQGADMKLPNVLIDRCALILLLLTDNFEQDENVQFLKEPALSNTRFCEDISNWQDYCVRPLHTQPQSERSYDVPFNLTLIHSYEVFDLTTQHARDKMEGLFNCYTWFRVNHEKRCRAAEERERKRSSQTVGSDTSSPGITAEERELMRSSQTVSSDTSSPGSTAAGVAILDDGSPAQHYKPTQDHTERKKSFNTEAIIEVNDQRFPDGREITPAITTQPERVVVVSAEVLVRTPARPVSHDEVFDETGDGNSEETLKLLQGGTDEEVTPDSENTPHLGKLLQDKDRQEKKADKRGFCCGCLSFLRWGRKSRKSEGVSFMELVDHD